MSLTIVPLTLREANAFVGEMHRHHRPVRGCSFCVGVEDEHRTLRGVAIAGRPVSRRLQDGRTLEVTRVATDGTPNACSKLYAAVRRAAPHLGYRRLVTYTLASESGASLRGAGWRRVADVSGGSWSRASRRREDRHPLGPKVRWEAETTPARPRSVEEEP